jgi:Ca2+-binding EF-hand superfamily protein
MFKNAAIVSMSLIAGIVIPAAATPSDADCKAMWSKADANKDGFVDGAEATKFLTAIKASGKIYDVNNDGKLSQEEFVKACKDGVFDSIK